MELITDFAAYDVANHRLFYTLQMAQFTPKMKQMIIEAIEAEKHTCDKDCNETCTQESERLHLLELVKLA